MNTGKKNLAASVAARLLNRAKETSDDYQRLFTNFCFERFLFRLGASEVGERFVLKGAMCLQLWADRPYRATRDLDLLRRGDPSFEAIRRDFEVICTTEAPPDGIQFDAVAIQIERIRAQGEGVGARVSLPARCGNAVYPLQIDLGVGDLVWPQPQPRDFPSILQFPQPRIFAYPPEAVIAEKLEAMVVLGASNSRIKDFFDIQFLAGRFEFDRATLVEAIQLSFGTRKTAIPDDDPIGLTEQFWLDPMRQPQLRAFARRSGLEVGPKPGEELLNALRPFLIPLLEDLRRGVATIASWPAGGPWQEIDPLGVESSHLNPVHRERRTESTVGRGV